MGGRPAGACLLGGDASQEETGYVCSIVGVKRMNEFADRDFCLFSAGDVVDGDFLLELAGDHLSVVALHVEVAQNVFL